MAEFSIQDAALTGFRVVREHPRAPLFWALFALLQSFVLSAILTGSMGKDYGRLAALAFQQPADPNEIAGILTRNLPAFGGIMLLLLISNALIGAAMLRSVLRPADDRFGFFRLGADEGRQLGLALLNAVVFMGAYVGLLAGAALISGLVSLAFQPAGALLLFFLVMGAFSGLIMLAVRLSLAPALTFDTGRINLWGSISLTRDRFWPLAGTYLIAAVLVVVVYLLGLLLIGALTALLGGGAASPPEAGSLGAWLSPAGLAQAVLVAGLSALVWPVMMTPAPAIYRAIVAAGRGSPMADSFS